MDEDANNTVTTTMAVQHEQQQGSSSSTCFSAFPKRTRVCDADDDETALTPPQAAKKVKPNDAQERSSAEGQAAGQVETEVCGGEAATCFAGEQGDTAARVNVMPGQAYASQQQAATPNASTTTGWQEQASAWLSGRGEATPVAKKSAAPTGTQSTPPAAFNNNTSADGTLPSLPAFAPEGGRTSPHPRMSQSYVFPTIYANGIHWHLIVPAGPPPPVAGDIQAYEVVRIPVISGGPSSFNGLPSTLNPPFAQNDPAGCHIAIVDGYVRYSFDEPLVGDPLGGEERYKVHVTRTLTPQGRQLLLRELAQPQPSVPLVSESPTTRQQQQPCPPQAATSTTDAQQAGEAGLERITDPETLANIRERIKRTEDLGPGWSPTPTPEPESPEGEELSCTSGHKAGHGQESTEGSHEGGGLMAKRNGEDVDRDGG